MLGFLPPYRQVRYHLREWIGNRPQTPQELFNLRHSSLRTTVERAFGTLKNRFKVLMSRPFYPFPTQVRVVIACCILHNWILQSGGADQFVYTEQLWRELYPRSNRFCQHTGAEQRQMTQLRDIIANKMFENRHLVIRDDAWDLHLNCTLLCVFVVSATKDCYLAVIWDVCCFGTIFKNDMCSSSYYSCNF